MRALQTGLLVVMGAYMVLFAAGDGYWRLLNPKYAWLTFLGGVVLLFVGAGCFLNRERRPRISEMLSIAVFLGLALAASLAPSPFAGDMADPEATAETAPSRGGFAGGSLTLHFDDEAAPEPETVFEGEAYTRLNLAELLAGEEGGWSVEDGRYAVQGAVYRSPELDAAGCISLRRLYVYCCLADAVEVSTLVRVDRPEAYAKGAWLHVLGVLRDGGDVPEAAKRAGGSISSVGSERFVLEAVRVEKRGVEGIPFILGIRGEPPFDY